MTRKSRASIRLLLLSRNEKVVNQLYRIGNNDLDIDIVGHSTRADEVIAMVHQRRSDVLFIDHTITDRLADLVQEVREAFPEQVIITTVPIDDLELAREVLLAGANGFVNLPLEEKETLKTIKKAYQLEKKRLQKLANQSNQPTAAESTVIAVFSAKGGMGVTTLSVNLALSLQVYEQQQVLLVEGSSMPGDIRTFLNINTKQTIDRLVQKHQIGEKGEILAAMQVHTSGLQILLNGESYDNSIAFPHEIIQVLDMVRDQFDTVIVDVGSLSDPHTGPILAAADILFLITQPTFPALNRTMHFLLAASRNKFNMSKVRLIMNRMNLKGGVDATSIAESLQLSFYATIEDDEILVNGAGNNGIPFVLSDKNSKVGKQIRHLAHLVAAERNPGQPSNTTTESTRLFNRISQAFSAKGTMDLRGIAS